MQKIIDYINKRIKILNKEFHDDEATNISSKWIAEELENIKSLIIEEQEKRKCENCLRNMECEYNIKIKFINKWEYVRVNYCSEFKEKE